MLSLTSSEALPSPSPPTEMTILLVEDNWVDVEILQTGVAQLEPEHWRLVPVESLAQAIATYRPVDNGIPENSLMPESPKGHYDLVLLDLGLPDSSGLDTLRTFLKHHPDAPIVVMTGLEDDALGLQAVRAGAQDSVIKGTLTPPKLRRVVQFAIERHRTVSRLRQQERQSLAALQQEQARNHLRSSVVSIVSHELRSPLAVIRTAVDLLSMTDMPLSEAKRQKYLRRITGEVDHLLALTSDILLLGRVSQQGLQCYPQRIPLRSFCLELSQRFQEDEKLGQPQIVCTFQGEATALLDEDLLRPILMNLLSNAIKYSPRGGLIELEVIAQPDVVVFRVQDSGIGIPSAEQGRLFESFYRCRNARGIAGHGLGLSIVKQCVDAQGGSISIDSEEGRGTTVIVSFPQSCPSTD